MAKITGILVNTTKGTARKATIEKSLDSYYKAIGCTCIDIVSRQIGPHRVDIICDDEGLLTACPIPSAFDSQQRPCLCGSLFVCAFDGVEDVTSLPDDTITDILQHYVRQAYSPRGSWSVLYPCTY